MNFGKSLKMAMASKEVSNITLAKDLGVNKTWVSTMRGMKHISSETIEKVAIYFEMKPSEFIKLGESDG